MTIAQEAGLVSMADRSLIGKENISRLPNLFAAASSELLVGSTSVKDREELVHYILSSLPISSLASVRRRLGPLLLPDIVGLLPSETILHILSYLPYQSLLACSLVNRRWYNIANDQSLWKRLCIERNWKWQAPRTIHHCDDLLQECVYSVLDDEGMGDDEDVDDATMTSFEDSGHASTFDAYLSDPVRAKLGPTESLKLLACHSAPPSMPSPGLHRPNYKLLYQTHEQLNNRVHSGSYRLSYLQVRGLPNSHASTIYCLQLYTYPQTGVQVLFTGSKDRTIREWDLTTHSVVRVIGEVHDSSVLSICVHNNLLASAGGDRKVAIWDLTTNVLVKIIQDHSDSVLCVRFDDEKLVSCSKDRTVRAYTLPHFTPQFVLRDHRAAVNAVSISPEYIVSASGDRSTRLWDAKTGNLLRVFEDHHERGIASIDFKPPYILTGSSDKQLKLLDTLTLDGWSTSASPEVSGSEALFGPRCECCRTCGRIAYFDENVSRSPQHVNLVRSVALGEEFVVSGSYDCTVKVWDRKSGALVADLVGGHTGRIFSVVFDCTKIISCGEDQQICIWDFSHDIDTSFISL